MEKQNIAYIKEGMVLAETVLCPKTKKLLLSCDTTLTKGMIDILKARGVTEIAVNDEYTIAINPQDLIKEEILTILEREILMFAPNKLEANTSDKMAAVSKTVRNYAAKIIDDYKVLEFCILMKLVNENFLYQHSLTTCALSLLIAGSLTLGAQNIYNIGVAALLHDIGLAEMPFLIGKKLIDNEKTLWNEHPKYGYYFLKEAGFDDEIVNLVLPHHEFWNGQGYPNRLAGEAIPLGSRIINVCDTYDDLIRLENYQNYQAVETLYCGGKSFFDPDVVTAFVNNLAVYPLGSIVRLSTGEVGAVVNVRKNLGPRPIVRVFYNRVNRPITNPKDIDLGEERTIFIEKILK